MDFLSRILETLRNGIFNDVESGEKIVSMLIMILIMTIYEFIVYRIINKKTLYNKSFDMLLLILPLFIGAIVYALQMNIVITLGTIGALAIIRFRTAVKDPLDMLYLLWAIFLGISCGCNLYKLCILTSLLATIIVLFSNIFKTCLVSKQYMVVINANQEIDENQISSIMKEVTKKIRLKSRNFTGNEIDYIYYVQTKEPNKIQNILLENKNIIRFSIIEYEIEDSI